MNMLCHPMLEHRRKFNAANDIFPWYSWTIIKSNGKQEINFDVQKISMLDLSKLTHDFFVAIRIVFPKS